MHRHSRRRNRKNRYGKILRAKFALPLLAALVAVATALWLAPSTTTPPMAQAQEATASCGSGPLHGRTQKVVDAILGVLSETDCSAVTTADLNGITGTMEIRYKSLNSLLSDDFEGLSSLQQLNLHGNDLTELPRGVFDGLSSLTHLRLWDNDLTTLPDGAFDDLSNLEFIRLNRNQLEWLPPDLFEETPNLTGLHMDANDQLACIHASQFDGLSSLELLELHNTPLGNINPTHFTRWSLNSLTELRFGGTLIADSSLNFADYQAVLPALVEANTRVDSGGFTDPICDTLERLADCGAGNPLHGRTQKVVDALLAALSATDCSAVTTTQLAGITALHLNGLRLRALQDGDFANLTGLINLHIQINQLTTLPSDVFDGLSSLQRIDLFDNELTTLPEDVFDGLSSLQELNMFDNELTTLPSDVFDGLSSLQTLRIYTTPLATLPEDVFDGLSSLETLDLHRNELTTLPEDLFDGLSSLQDLELYDNSLDTLPEDLFDGLSSLQELNLSSNSLDTLPEDLFDGLSSLGQLNLSSNSLDTLPEDLFDGLSSLNALRLPDNSLDTLPEDVFDGLSSMTLLRLDNNSLDTLPPDLFDGLSNLRELYLTDNGALACIHAGQFDGLTNLRELHLAGTKLGNIDPTPYAAQWGLNELEELRFGGTSIGSSSLNFQDYKDVFRDLVESRTYVRDPAELSQAICGFIVVEPDGTYDGTIQVWLNNAHVYPNRARTAGTSGDGHCGSETAEAQHELWTWQSSSDGVTWTDLTSGQQPKPYGTRGAGECSFLYTPQTADNNMYLRAYVKVDTAGVGENNYHSAPFGPLNVRP